MSLGLLRAAGLAKPLSSDQIVQEAAQATPHRAWPWALIPARPHPTRPLPDRPRRPQSTCQRPVHRATLGKLLTKKFGNRGCTKQPTAQFGKQVKQRNGRQIHFAETAIDSAWHQQQWDLLGSVEMVCPVALLLINVTATPLGRCAYQRRCLSTRACASCCIHVLLCNSSSAVLSYPDLAS